ncbi:hypothetical protein OIO90_002683 [Microbotryomycetes sp. JL221]|nr:hypothetical protein OIO90_002683 [Microbotryomycetes sp. JL221]
MACSRTASPSSSGSSRRSFSTTTVTHESKQRRKARLTRRAHAVKKQTQLDQLEQTKPDPVLGYNTLKPVTVVGRSQQQQQQQQRQSQTNASEETLWDKSLLKNILLDRNQVWGQTIKVVANEQGTVTNETVLDHAEDASSSSLTSDLNTTSAYVPQHFNFGLTRDEADKLVNVLPAVSAVQSLVGKNISSGVVLEKRLERAQREQQDNRNKLMRIVDLRNADSKGIAVENTRRIIDAFKRSDNDTASPEVQAALLTAKIHNLKDHLTAQPRDIHNQRPLRTMIHQRAKILKYLRSVDVGRYEECLARIGVEPRAVEGEVMVTKQGLRQLIKGV